MNQTLTPILVCGNAGAAGPDLLRRRDVQVYWALSTEEALAVARVEKPKVALAREHLANAILAGTAHSGRIPCVVLLEAEGWSKKDSYFSLGATALVGANSGERILEAVSELTGLVFARHPRVPFKTVVEVTLNEETKLLETVDLSASGVCIKGVENTRVGTGGRVSFEMLDPPLTLHAMVVRTFKDRGEPMAGLCFDEITDLERARMATLVESERTKRDSDPKTRSPVSEAFTPTNTEGQYADHDSTGDIVFGNQDRTALRDRLLARTTAASETTGETDLSWLDRAVRHLTPLECSLVLEEPNAPAWVNGVLDMRLMLLRSRAETGSHPAELVQQALAVCKGLADTVHNPDDKALVQVAAARASLLRELESDKKKSRLGTVETFLAGASPMPGGGGGGSGGGGGAKGGGDPKSSGKKGKRKAANA